MEVAKKKGRKRKWVNPVSEVNVFYIDISQYKEGQKDLTAIKIEDKLLEQPVTISKVAKIRETWSLYPNMIASWARGLMFLDKETGEVEFYSFMLQPKALIYAELASTNPQQYKFVAINKEVVQC